VWTWAPRGWKKRVDVRGDKALIEGMLNNLLDNALRYGSRAAPRVTVACAARKLRACSAERQRARPGRAAAGAVDAAWTQGTQARRSAKARGWAWRS